MNQPAENSSNCASDLAGRSDECIAAADAPTEPKHRPRYAPMTVAVGILTGIAIVAALYLSRAFFIPLLIGILASYALRPLVNGLSAFHIPPVIAAALVLIMLVGCSTWIAFAVKDDVTTMVEKLPEAARKLRQRLSAERRAGPTALQHMQEAANEIQGAAADAGARPGARVITARATEPTAWLRDYAVAQSALLFAVAGQAPIVLLLAYFLLASGSHFRRKLVQFVGPSFARKKDTVRILGEIDVQIQRYLLSILVSNVLVGVATWLAFEAIGLEHAGAWGIFAGILHFVPYLGPLVVALAAAVAGFLQFGTVVHALAIAGISTLLAGAIGMGFLTWLQGRFAGVSAAVLFISLLFFGWLWGIAGLLLGAPIVAITKLICDRVEALKPFGNLLGR